MAVRKPLVIIGGQVQELPAADTVAVTASPWAVFRNNVLPGESVTVPADSFMLCLSGFDLQGTIDNQGTVVIL